MAMVTAVTDDTLAVANRLRPLLLHLNRHLRREARAQGITPGKVSLLSAIEDHAGIGVGDLAAREGMSSPSISVQIDQLAAAGYVRRVRDAAGDRRRVGLEVTSAGSKLLRTVRSRRTAWLARRLRDLSPEQRGEIAGALDALAALVGHR
ncbi:MAG: MarR family winged helix-turn-helix transcriptional regulator [Candidatus Dormibacteria bacterium]